MVKPTEQFALGFLFAAILLNACTRSETPEKNSRATAPKSANGKTNDATEKTYLVKGVIKELPANGTNVVIKHEEVIGFMPAMTMPFDVKKTNDLQGFKVGDAVSFRLVVAGDDSWIEQLRRLNTSPTEMPSRESWRQALDVEPLKVGELLPDYHFTNELGAEIHLRDFKGQALALTFIFTRCPLPNFCPRMSSNFAEAEKKILAQANSPTNWHFFSLSFDPEHDSPAVLKSYAERYHYDPAHWNFLTGELINMSALAQQFGQTFWWEQGTINHNLRTAVIDAKGKLQKIFVGNNWSSDDLVTELLKGASAPGD